MIFRLAVRSLSLRPLRTMVLAIGFGLAIAVMAELVGVGEVILEQAHAPALAGGGDVVVAGTFGPLESGRFVLADVLTGDRFRRRVRAASPSRRATLYLLDGASSVAVSVRGGIPDREAALGDPEVAGQAEWRNTPNDDRWINPTGGDLLRSMDRFHPVPATTAGPGVNPASWAEWLYFNGRSADGSLRFYLTFLAGGGGRSGTRPAIVRLQLHRNGTTTNYSSAAGVDARRLLDAAPDVDFGDNHVHVDDDGTYRLTLDLRPEPPEKGVRPLFRKKGVRPLFPGRLTAELALTPAAGRSLPPAEIQGAGGWMSGYVVPVLSGRFSGRLRVDDAEIPVDGLAGYHDHNWGYWQGVRWQWGQVAGGGVSIVYGRLFPPADVADPARVPGFLGVIGADGPVGFSTNVTIREDDANGAPRSIVVESHDQRLPMTLRFDATEMVRTPMALTAGGPGGTLTFMQLGGEYRVSGRAGGADIDFSARGSAETFR